MQASSASTAKTPVLTARAAAQQGQQPGLPPRTTPGFTGATSESNRTAGGGIHIPNILPHERVFPIQIGSELFKLSGASLSSDAPSYFSQYFQCQLQMAAAAAAMTSTTAATGGGSDGSSSHDEQAGSTTPGSGTAPAAVAAAAPPIRTLYIDRDPGTFRDISLHLQGYYVQPRDGTHFVRLFADAQFYSLPRLISQLYEQSIFLSVGHREFQIPRELLFQDPGNAPNFFTLGFAVFFSTPDNLFPGLDRTGLLRPPSILPPAVPGRSAETFAELLHLLRGYPVAIRNEAHRQTLLRDCRYFHFRGLEQKLLPHTLAFNQARRRHEIALRLEDVLKSGLSVRADATASSDDTPPRWVHYARPFVDDQPAELVLEIGGENTQLHFVDRTTTRAEFFRDTKTRMVRLFEVLATKLNLPTTTTQPLGLLLAQGQHGGAGSQPPSPGHTPLCDDDRVRVVLDTDTAITLDGHPLVWGEGGEEEETAGDLPPRKRRRVDDTAAPSTWIVQTGQWRLRIAAAAAAAVAATTTSGKSAVECVLVGVKLDATSSELARNRARGFLGG